MGNWNWGTTEIDGKKVRVVGNTIYDLGTGTEIGKLPEGAIVQGGRSSGPPIPTGGGGSTETETERYDREHGLPFSRPPSPVSKNISGDRETLDFFKSISPEYFNKYVRPKASQEEIAELRKRFPHLFIGDGAVLGDGSQPTPKNPNSPVRFSMGTDPQGLPQHMEFGKRGGVIKDSGWTENPQGTSRLNMGKMYAPIGGAFGGLLRGAKNLFEDPTRMALLSGGLSAMDPNSYYDKQGFYSPWTGLQAGLGTGIRTYKKLGEPRKLGFKEQERIKHENAMALEGVKSRSGAKMGEFRRVLGAYNALPINHPDRLMLKNRLSKLNAMNDGTNSLWNTWLEYREMLPEAMRNDPNEYHKFVRGQPWLDIGPSFKQPSPLPGGTSRTVGKDLDPKDEPAHIRAAKDAEHQSDLAATLRENKPKDRLLLRQALRKAEGMDVWIDYAKELASAPWATGGIGSVAEKMPWSTQASELEDYLTTIRANLGFDKLQEMREASKTGGALGQISEMENKLLQAVNGALNPKNQRVLLRNLEIIRVLYPIVLEEKQKLYEETYGEVVDIGGLSPASEENGAGFKIKRIN